MGGNNECFEPYTSNVYVRRTLAGEFVCINSHLLRDLIKLGIWTPLLKDKLIAANGSVQMMAEVPADLKAIYKTVWEISQKNVDQYGGGSGSVYRPIDVVQHSYDRSECGQTDVNALLWLEKGTEDGNVLFEDKGGRGRDQVYGGSGRV